VKIEILDAENPESTPFVLLEGGLESPEDQEMRAESLVQPREHVRAAAGGVFARGNLTRTHTFQCTRQYNTAGAAELALYEHPEEVPTGGLVRLTFEPVAEESPVVRLLHHAVVHAFAARQVGASVIWRYTITGGAITEPPEET
jgi:hypothetical protein